MMPKSDVRAENTRALVGSPGKQPDILITADDRAPVVIEAEFMPARTVEPEALERIGLKTEADGRVIEAVIALRYPPRLEDADDLPSTLRDATFSYCVFTEERAGPSRFPESGWLQGNTEALADMVRLVSVPQRAVYEAAGHMQEGIDNAAKVLEDASTKRPAITMEIAETLGMANVQQTWRMACAIIANALVFHERIAGMHTEIKSLERVCGPSVPNPQSEVAKAWDDILKINYWSIFSIAKDILQILDSEDATLILRDLFETAKSVRSSGIDNSHDLTGRIFQRLIADRKYLATFYTLPASAALLARLAVAKMDGVDWSDLESIGKLRVADFACGTGALLSAVYEQIAARHERAGGDSTALHKVMMENVLYGCDVMPSAVHITGSTLSGVEPSVDFQTTHLYTLPYGRQEDGSVMIGSLELLRSSAIMTLFNMSDPAMRTGRTGEETATQILAEFPDESYDLIIMNPPFVSNTKHYDADEGVLNAAFAAYDSSEKDQKDMASRMKSLSTGSVYHGHAGLASAFAEVGFRKLRPGGVMALVLPFTAISSSSWTKFRELIATHFQDITVFGIAASGSRMTFSADTGMADCLVLARRTVDEEISNSAIFVSLLDRPASFLSSLEIDKNLRQMGEVRQLEAGPFGGNKIQLGDVFGGEVLRAPISSGGGAWGAAGIADYSVAQFIYALGRGSLWLPGEKDGRPIPITKLAAVGNRGVDHQLLVSTAHKAPFIKGPPSPTATYPSLWNHDATKETRLVRSPDSQMSVRIGMEDDAVRLWAVAGRAHITQDFRFTSQPLCATFTEQRALGGTAWPNVNFGNRRFDYPFTLWSNSTLGLMVFWWHSNRQQSGRGRITINDAETLPVLDFRALSDTQLAKAEEIFEEFRDKEFMPAYLADADPNRALLDQRVITDLLGFDEEVFEGVRRLAQKWCAEPSVHGGKPRPKDAKFVLYPPSS